jgi:hypothetical protein
MSATKEQCSKKGKKRNAPLLYSPKMIDKICNYIIEGKSVNAICRMRGMPNRTTIGKWLEKYPEFSDRYIRAKQIQTYFNADELMDMAKDCDGNSSSAVQKAKLLVDTQKWISSRMLPKIYGEQTKQIQVEQVINTKALDEVLDKVKSLSQPKPKELIDITPIPQVEDKE